MVKKLVLAALLLPGAAALNIVAAQMEHMAKPSAGFSQLTPLAGEWEGTEGAKAVHGSSEGVSAGTALLERLKIAGDPEMVTIYTPDGDRLAATHFCSSGNQPQMSTEP